MIKIEIPAQGREGNVREIVGADLCVRPDKLENFENKGRTHRSAPTKVHI